MLNKMYAVMTLSDYNNSNYIERVENDPSQWIGSLGDATDQLREHRAFGANVVLVKREREPGGSEARFSIVPNV